MPARLGGALLLGSVACGCSVLEARDCSDVGVVSGVVIDFSRVLAAHPHERMVAEVCVERACTTVDVGARRQQEAVVGQDPLEDDTPVAVTMTMTDRRGHTVAQDRLTAVPSFQQPNGPGCPPTAWSVPLVASRTGELRQVGPPS